MSDAWHGGKGDKSRVTDMTAYWNCPLWNRSAKNRKALFLDDSRSPKLASLWGLHNHPRLTEVTKIPDGSWSVVRSYDEFVEYIENNGIPDVVSFDNDLIDFQSHKVSLDDVKRLFSMEDWQTIDPKTGAHCAQYLASECIRLQVPIPEYYIHSANNAAHPIIQNILENARHEIQS